MNKLLTILILFPIFVNGQTPEKMSYQALVRDAGNNLVINSTIGMQFSILQGSIGGTAVYVETQTPTTSAQGLVNLEIGMGSVVTGTFASIDWSAGPYFLKTETDPTGVTNYTITGTAELLSVPYALHAKTAESATSFSETDPFYSGWNKKDGISITESQVSDLQNYLTNDAGNQSITNLADPTNAQDAATMNYVISQLAILKNELSDAGVATPPYDIGDFILGGVVAYILQPGDPGYDANLQHGIIVADVNQSSAVEWGCTGSTIPGADGTIIGTGLQNTADIIAGCASTAIAAKLCNDLVLNGYDDWYLPSKGELEKLNINILLYESNMTPYDNDFYWSSTESSSANAWRVWMGGGGGDAFSISNKNTSSFSARAIRSF